MEPGPLYQPSPSAAASSGYHGGNLPLAIVAGLVAALLGAVLWSALVAAIHVKIGFAAIGIGLLVGWAMRQAGQGHSPTYGYAAAVLALLGCVLGDVLTDCVFIAEHLGQPVQQVITHLTPDKAWLLLQAGFQPLDALFYLIALRAGYRYAFSR